MKKYLYIGQENGKEAVIETSMEKPSEYDNKYHHVVDKERNNNPFFDGKAYRKDLSEYEEYIATIPRIEVISPIPAYWKKGEEVHVKIIPDYCFLCQSFATSHNHCSHDTVAIPIDKAVEPEHIADTGKMIGAGFREFILCAAVHYRDGNVYKEQPLNIESGLVVMGRRHNNCFRTLEYVTGFDINKIKAADFGFVTSTNRFVTRKEGMVIAMRENQIYHSLKYREGDILTSEDLYQDNDN